MNRRGFLGNVGKALAGIVAAPVVAKAAVGAVEAEAMPEVSALSQWIPEEALDAGTHTHSFSFLTEDAGAHTHYFSAENPLWPDPFLQYPLGSTAWESAYTHRHTYDQGD